jgi:urea transport system permease protein
VAVSLVVIWLACRWLLASSFGRVCVAIRENELRAQLLGYDVRLIKTGLFTLGGAIAGLAGAFYASWAEIVTPSLFSLAQSAEIIIWVIVGGVGTLLGPIFGAMLLAALKIALGQPAAGQQPRGFGGHPDPGGVAFARRGTACLAQSVARWPWLKSSSRPRPW